jgi:hypothetical protein
MTIPDSPMRGPGYTDGFMRPALVFLALVACSPAPAPVASSPADPSNPKAPEGVDPVAQVQASSATPAPAAYVCPMHPDVIAGRPDRCPKCGMVLVPQK